MSRPIQPLDTTREYNWLTPIRFIGLSKSGSLWECRCRCGKIITRRASDVRLDYVKSCGCLRTKTSKGIEYNRKTAIKFKLFRLEVIMTVLATNKVSAAIKKFGLTRQRINQIMRLEGYRLVYRKVRAAKPWGPNAT